MNHSILHTVNRSPFIHTALEQCLSYSKESDSILLLEDGVYSTLVKHPFADKLSDKTCYAIEVDLKARGLSDQELAPHIQLIDFAYFVELTTQYQLVQSWY